MLVLARKRGEVIIVKIGQKELAIKITDISNYRVKLGFEGDREFVIVREELNERRHRKERKISKVPSTGQDGENN